MAAGAPLAPWRARFPVGANMTRENREGWCRWPTAGGGRPGRARGCGRLALPAVVPAAAGTPATRILRASTQAVTLPAWPPVRPAPPPADRARAPARATPGPAPAPAACPATPFRFPLVMSAPTGNRARQGASGMSTSPARRAVTSAERRST